MSQAWLPTRSSATRLRAMIPSPSSRTSTASSRSRIRPAAAWPEGNRFSCCAAPSAGTRGTRKTVEAGLDFVREVLNESNDVSRQPVPASHLKVALQCGGSDGYSGVSANPALGVASDLVVRHGGTAILAETTETYGAEHLFTRRAVSREVGEKLVELMYWWEDIRT